MSELLFEDFLQIVDDENKTFALDVHHFLLQNGYNFEIKDSKSGFTVSYLMNKKVLATYICRRTGVKLRIYPQYLPEYESFLDTLPEKMKKEIKKSSVCKRLLNPSDCNPKCKMGYDFYLDQEHYQKCRYMAFQPSLNKENNPFILTFLERELSLAKK